MLQCNKYLLQPLDLTVIMRKISSCAVQHKTAFPHLQGPTPCSRSTSSPPPTRPRSTSFPISLSYPSATSRSSQKPPPPPPAPPSRKPPATRNRSPARKTCMKSSPSPPPPSSRP